MISPQRRNSTTGEVSILLAVGDTVQGTSGYYAVPGKYLWQYWTFDEEEGWELITDQVEPITEDTKTEDEFVQDMQNESAITKQTTDVLFELFAHYGQDDQETDRLVESTLASGNVNVEAHDDRGKTLLLCACESSNLHVVTQVVRMGANVDKPNFFGVTPLHVSCYEQSWSLPICKYLLEHKAFPNAMDSEQCTPLHYAACGGHVVLVAMLLLHKAQANQTDCRGFTPLDYAVQFGHHEVAELLSTVAATGDEWVEYMDQKTGYPYYMSSVTGETRWLRPSDETATSNKLILKILRDFRSSQQPLTVNTGDRTENRRDSTSSVSSDFGEHDLAAIVAGEEANQAAAAATAATAAAAAATAAGEDGIVDVGDDDVEEERIDKFPHPSSPLMKSFTRRTLVAPPGQPGQVQNREEWDKWATSAIEDSNEQDAKKIQAKLEYEQSQMDLLKMQIEVVQDDGVTSKDEVEALRKELEAKDAELRALATKLEADRESEIQSAQDEARQQAEGEAKQRMAAMEQDLKKKKAKLEWDVVRITLDAKNASAAEAEKKKNTAIFQAQTIAELRIANVNKQLASEKEAANLLQAQLEKLTTNQSAEQARRKEIEEQAERARKQQQEMEALVKKMQEENEALKKTVVKEQEQRRFFFNQVEDLKGRIRVYCRVRPLSSPALIKENENDVPSSRRAAAVRSAPDTVTITKTKENVAGQLRKIVKHFKFDVVFGPKTPQETVFEDTRLLIQSACDGYNVCIFCYGQTGSGKTHTMLGDGTGTAQGQGIVPRAVQQVFNVASKEADTKSFRVRFYQVELYCDKLIDLFAVGANSNSGTPTANGTTGERPNSSSAAMRSLPLAVKTDENGLVYIENAVVHEVANVTHLHELMEQGSARRVVAETIMNAESSRSHLVSTILIETTNLASGDVSTGKLTLVDLAGSERVERSGALLDQDKMKEAQSINQSLSALGNVIHALVEGAQHVPYRDNNLTKLMSDSLGGNAKTLVIVNVSPCVDDLAETESSLLYAQRIKKVKNSSPTKNVETKEISALKAQLAKHAKKKAGSKK